MRTRPKPVTKNAGFPAQDALRSSGMEEGPMYKYPHVHQFVDRHGKVRRYFRRRGCKQVRLIGSPGSPAFLAAYTAGLTGCEPVEPESRAHGGTVGPPG